MGGRLGPEHAAEAGKAAYALPVYANAWLVQHEGQKAGQYPSGGPVSKVLDVWRAAAPAIDLLTPDIYLPDFKGVCASYSRSGNALFIPEAGRGPDAAAKAFYAVGRHGALGFAPFGIDSAPPDHPLGPAYEVLAEVAPLVLEASPARTAGLLEDKEEREMAALGGYGLEVQYTRSEGGSTHGGSRRCFCSSPPPGPRRIKKAILDFWISGGRHYSPGEPEGLQCRSRASSTLSRSLRGERNGPLCSASIFRRRSASRPIS